MDTKLGRAKTGHKNIIELNGKRYDAVTGKVIDGITRIHTETKKNVDGFISSVPHSITRTVSSKAARQRHINHKPAHKPEPAKTLRRDSVPKPIKSKIKLSKAQVAKSDSLVAQTAVLLDTRASRKAIADSRRENLAKQISQHPKVRRFTDSVVTYAGPKVSNMGLDITANPTPIKSEKNHQSNTKDSKAHLQQMLNDGLARSTSHQQPVPKIKKNRFKTSHVSSYLSILIVLAGLGASLYFFRINIELKLASMHTGVHALLPGYMPSGYHIKGPVSYSSDDVTVSYQDGHQIITISEHNSAWDSQTLKDSEVSNNFPNYQTVHSQGNTIYLFDKGKATWVNDNIWFLISSNPSTPDSQLVKIANSL